MKSITEHIIPYWFSPLPIYALSTEWKCQRQVTETATNQTLCSHICWRLCVHIVQFRIWYAHFVGYGAHRKRSPRQHSKMYGMILYWVFMFSVCRVACIPGISAKRHRYCASSLRFDVEFRKWPKNSENLHAFKMEHKHKYKFCASISQSEYARILAENLNKMCVRAMAMLARMFSLLCQFQRY